MEANQLKGVRGWLLVFCLSMTVRPLITVYTVLVLLPAFTSPTDPFAILLGYYCMTILIVAFGLYSAFLLWTVHKNAVITAKVNLVVMLIYWILLAFFPFLLPSDRRESGLATYFGIFQHQLLSGVGYFVIWFSYLSKSKRVANTYAPEALPSASTERALE